jgi:hypothetical protein
MRSQNEKATVHQLIEEESNLKIDRPAYEKKDWCCMKGTIYATNGTQSSSNRIVNTMGPPGDHYSDSMH